MDWRAGNCISRTQHWLLRCAQPIQEHLQFITQFNSHFQLSHYRYPGIIPLANSHIQTHQCLWFNPSKSSTPFIYTQSNLDIQWSLPNETRFKEGKSDSDLTCNTYFPLRTVKHLSHWNDNQKGWCLPERQMNQCVMIPIEEDLWAKCLNTTSLIISTRDVE